MGISPKKLGMDKCVVSPEPIIELVKNGRIIIRQNSIMSINKKKMIGAVLVEGGGIAGVQASLDLANFRL